MDLLSSNDQKPLAHVSAALTPVERNLLDNLDRLKFFLATAPSRWTSAACSTTPAHHPALNRFLLPSGEHVSCVLWRGLYHITGTDIVRALIFRFEAFGRPVRHVKKFEEGVFSDLRNLKPGQDACLEEPKSAFLDLLFKYQCIRTQKKQKVFYWFSVPHNRLFLDALERDLKREKMGLEPTSVVVAEPALSFRHDTKRSLFEQFSQSHSDLGSPNDDDLTSSNGVQLSNLSMLAPTRIPSLVNVEGLQARTGAGPQHAKLKVEANLSHAVETEPLSNCISVNPLKRNLDAVDFDQCDGDNLQDRDVANQLRRAQHNPSRVSMLSLFEGSPTYKQRRKRATKAGAQAENSMSDVGANQELPRFHVSPSNGFIAHMADASVSIDSALPVVLGPCTTTMSVDSPLRQMDAHHFKDHALPVVLGGSLQQSFDDFAFDRSGNSVPVFSCIPEACSSPYTPSDSPSSISALGASPDCYATSSSYADSPSSSPFIPTSAQSTTVPRQLTAEPPRDVLRSKAFACPLVTCGRFFKRMEHLKRHLRTHTMEKPYRCERCQKRFSRSDNLNQHMRTHGRLHSGQIVNPPESPEATSPSDGYLQNEMLMRGVVSTTGYERDMARHSVGLVAHAPPSTIDDGQSDAQQHKGNGAGPGRLVGREPPLTVICELGDQASVAAELYATLDNSTLYSMDLDRPWIVAPESDVHGACRSGSRTTSPQQFSCRTAASPVTTSSQSLSPEPGMPCIMSAPANSSQPEVYPSTVNTIQTTSPLSSAPPSHGATTLVCAPSRNKHPSSMIGLHFADDECSADNQSASSALSFLHDHDANRDHVNVLQQLQPSPDPSRSHGSETGSSRPDEDESVKSAVRYQFGEVGLGHPFDHTGYSTRHPSASHVLAGQLDHSFLKCREQPLISHDNTHPLSTICSAILLTGDGTAMMPSFTGSLQAHQSCSSFANPHGQATVALRHSVEPPNRFSSYLCH